MRGIARRRRLSYGADHAKDELRDLARLRAALLLLDEKAYDLALKQLEGASSLAFEVRFQDTRADVLSAQNKKAEAVAAYQAALPKLENWKSGKSASAGQEWQGQSNAILRDLLTQKIDAIWW